MTTILVWTKDQSLLPLKYEDVDFYHKTRKTLEVIQEVSYITTTTTIMKDSIIRYSVIDQRA